MVKSLAAKAIQSNVHRKGEKKQMKQQSHKNPNHSSLIFELTVQRSKLASVCETLFIWGSGNCESCTCSNGSHSKKFKEEVLYYTVPVDRNGDFQRQRIVI